MHACVHLKSLLTFISNNCIYILNASVYVRIHRSVCMHENILLTTFCPTSDKPAFIDSTKPPLESPLVPPPRFTAGCTLLGLKDAV